MPTKNKQPRIVDIALRLPLEAPAGEAMEKISLLGDTFYRARLAQDRKSIVVLQAREVG